MDTNERACVFFHAISFFPHDVVFYCVVDDVVYEYLRDLKACLTKGIEGKVPITRLGLHSRLEGNDVELELDVCFRTVVLRGTIFITW